MDSDQAPEPTMEDILATIRGFSDHTPFLGRPILRRSIWKKCASTSMGSGPSRETRLHACPARSDGKPDFSGTAAWAGIVW
jgi:hypothetical protein